MRLPDSFKSSIASLLNEDADEFFASYKDAAVSGLNVNTLKITTELFEEKACYSIGKIPFASNGYYVSDTDAWSKHPYYYAGLYYLQEPSAMIPSQILPVREGDRVLDLCAAPGGKSTNLLLRHPRILVANDISRTRTIPLVKNLEHRGGDYAVTCMEPGELAGEFPGVFDCILVDAPCSGEGMFRKDPALIASYEERGPGYYRPIQERILESAYEMLCDGGHIVYSTCTFSDIEDEQVMLSFLDKHPDIIMLDIPKEYGLCGPYDMYSECGNISGCVHAFPHRFGGEGHFAALLRKEGTGIKPVQVHEASPTLSFKDLPESAREFFSHCSKDRLALLADSRFIVTADGQVCIIPEGFSDMYRKSIRYSRTGLIAGTIGRSGRFVPHTAFALSLTAEDFGNVIDFDSKDDNILRYLKGETLISPGNTGSGFVLVCTDGFPLGFASSDGKKLKNMYEKGWIYK